MQELPHAPQDFDRHAQDSLRRPRKLAVFGNYSDRDLYQRNRTLVSLLTELSDDTVVVRPGTREGLHGFAARRTWWQGIGQDCKELFSLWSQRRRLHGRDTIFVPYPAYLSILLLWVCGSLRGRQLIVDAFLELHSTVVEDRGLLPPNSLRAGLLLAFQRFCLARADLLLIDTEAQAEQLRARLGRRFGRILDVPVGIDESIWKPQSSPSPLEGRYRVLFWGTFVPLQGAEYIARAAQLLQSRDVPVDFHIIGDGQTANTFAEELERQPVEHLHWERGLVDSEALVKAISQAHIVLGVFGSSRKAGAVVPYKVHQGLACNRPVVSRISEALGAAESNASGLVLCPPGDPVALADAIEALVRRLATGWNADTRRIYDLHFSTAVLRERLQGVFEPDKSEQPQC